MKLLYLSTWDFSNEESDGVCKKIKSQISVFEQRGYQVDFVFIKNNHIIFKEDGIEKTLTNVGKIKKTPAYYKMHNFLKKKSYDWVYNRYGMMDTFYYRVLKKLHHNGAKIIIELPTYPYVNEVPKGILYKIMIRWDEKYISRLKKCVNLIATYSEHKSIFGITTVKLINGIDFSQIQLKEEKKPNEFLDLIGVAHLSKWHGFDRMIEGLHEYYQNDNVSMKVRFHIVGDGDCLKEYDELVKKYYLENFVFFYGNKSGQELDKLYNESDLAISSLALHRIGIKTCASVLKSREYSAKGLPMVSSIAIDIFPKEHYKYILYVSEDDAPVDINKVIAFWKVLSTEGTDNRRIIREYAYRRCDQSIALNPIIEYMEKK